LVMRPVFARAKTAPKRVVYAEGEEERVLRAVQTVVDEHLAVPVLIGRPEVVAQRIERAGLRIRPGEHFELIDPQNDARYRDYWQTFHAMMERRGITPDVARQIVRTNTTVIGALMLEKGDGDALICGTIGRYQKHLQNVLDVVGLRPGVKTPAALSAVTTSKGVFFFCDTHVSADPSADEVAEMALLAAEEVRRFGLSPKVALLSHSNFGSHDSPSAVKMRQALQEILERAPELEVEGEMHGDTALSEEIRTRLFPNSKLKGQANLLVMPTLDAANIAFNLAKSLGDGIAIGPLLLGVGKPAHILTPSATVRRIVNMTAIATVDAQMAQGEVAEGGGI
ncbi:MAG TPA: phosphate acyltransferase, partial [Alphaproteobacteria bacterium]|nr:phosphate acyltransferase [Alphaproteobacteria bacterium]